MSVSMIPIFIIFAGLVAAANCQQQPGACTCQIPASAKNLIICGTDGNKYNNPCDLVNAQSKDNKLGSRPCDVMAAQRKAVAHAKLIPLVKPSRRVAGDPNAPSELYPNGPPSAVCLTNNVTVSSPQQVTDALVQSSSNGVRCPGPCPCTLRCPSPFQP